MTTVYNATYYDRQIHGAMRSAQRVVPLVHAALHPTSVVDFGCGRGAWTRVWMDAGVLDVQGLDGAYVTPDRLLIPPHRFTAADLTSPLVHTQRWELAQSLEVAEHLPEASATTFIATLTAAAPRILFGAAVPGQGGAQHINEQPLEYWRALFRAQGFLPFDWLRPQLQQAHDVEPWYRFNTMLYVHRDAIAALPASVRDTAVPESRKLQEGGSMRWRIRRALVRPLPRSVVDAIARGLSTVHARRHPGTNA